MFGKPKSIVYLRRSSLELYTDKSQSSVEKLQFPTALVSSEEVLDPEGLARFLNDFFTKVTSNVQKAVIILSDELTFSKTINLRQITNEELEAQKRQFFESVPVDLHQLSKLEVAYKDSLYLIACNKRLYESVVKSLSGLGREVEFVVPAIVFGVSSNAPLTGVDIHKIVSGRELVKISNLLTASRLYQETDTLDVSTRQKGQKSDQAVFDARYFFVPAFVIIVIFIIVGGYIFLSGQKKINFSFINFRLFSLGATPKPLPVSSPSHLASPDIQNQVLSDKGQITVEVINGTGKAGQAGKVKTMLESMGFSKIATGNTQDSAATVTTVDFAGDVSSDVIGEIEKELSTAFGKIETSKQTSNSNYKIIITTGPENNP